MPTNGVVPDLFGETANPLPKADTSNLGVVNAVMAKGGQQEKILGPKPKTSAGLDIQPETFRFGSYLFKFAVVALIATYGFFYTQLSPSFTLLGQNPVQRLSSFQQGLAKEQTEINLYNFMIVKFALDEFSVAADSYLYHWAQHESEYTPENVRAELKPTLNQLQEDMIASLSIMKENLTGLLYPKTLAFSSDPATLTEDYALLLKNKINEERIKLNKEKDPESVAESMNLESTLALINSEKFQAEIKALDLDQALTAEHVERLFGYATEISKNEFSTILHIKNQRVHWSTVIHELERVTKEVDPLYNSGIRSNLMYTNLSFNASDEMINLRGSTTTDDTLNFSLTSDLIDALERSPLFADVSDRSFSKNLNRDEDFTSGFNIELKLQHESDPRDEKVVPITSSSTTQKTPEEAPLPREEEEQSSSADSEEAEALHEESSDPVPETSEESASNSFFGAASLLNLFETFSHKGPVPRH